MTGRTHAEKIQMIENYLKKKGLKKTDLIQHAGISKSHGKNVLAPNFTDQPNRNTPTWVNVAVFFIELAEN